MDANFLECACGARLKLPPNAIGGKRFKCPKCSAVLVVPEQPPQALSPAALAAAYETTPAASNTKPCEYCGETILATAKKCKHCGEFLGDEPVSTSQKSSLKAARGKTGPVEDEPGPAEYFTAIVFAPIGLIIGIVWAIKKEHRAKKMILVSGLMTIILMPVCWLAYGYFVQPEESKAEVLAVGDNIDTSKMGPQPGSAAYEEMRKKAEQRRNAMSSVGEVDLSGQPAHIQKAMKANVRLAIDDGLGSGVVLQRDGDQVLIITNRHVIDHKYAEDPNGTGETPLKDLTKPRVSYFDRQSNDGAVVWVAPSHIDLALVKAKAPQDIEPIVWQTMPILSSGQDVFAIGNPVGLDWSFSKGVVSQLRKIPSGTGANKFDVPMIQTDTSLIPGNSGGGLYTSTGELVGINTSVINPAFGSLGFSIRVTILLQLKPPGLTLPEKTESKTDEGDKDTSKKDAARKDVPKKDETKK